MTEELFDQEWDFEDDEPDDRYKPDQIYGPIEQESFEIPWDNMDEDPDERMERIVQESIDNDPVLISLGVKPEAEEEDFEFPAAREIDTDVGFAKHFMRYIGGDSHVSLSQLYKEAKKLVLQDEDED